MLIEQKLSQIKLSDAQHAVADYMLKQRYHMEKMTIQTLAKNTYTSVATIIRLAKKLGYSGYQEMKDDFLKEVHYLDSHFQKIDPNYPFSNYDNMQKIAYKVAALTKEAVDDTLTLIDHDSLQKAVMLMKNSPQIHLCALSYSLLLGHLFQMDMLRIGVPIHIHDISGDELFLPAIVQKNDTVLFISYSGQMEKLCLLAKQLKKQNAHIIVISSLGNNDLKTYSDVSLHLSTREKLHSKIKGYTNEASIKFLLDVLYSCYFALDYSTNQHKRLEICQFAETSSYSSLRRSTLDVLKENQEVIKE